MISWTPVPRMFYSILPDELKSDYFVESERFLNWHQATIVSKFGRLVPPRLDVAALEARSPLLRERTRDHELTWWSEVLEVHHWDSEVRELAWYRHNLALYKLWDDTDQEVAERTAWLDQERNRIQSMLFFNHPAHQVGVLVKYEHHHQYHQYLIGGSVTSDSDWHSDTDIPADAVVVGYCDLLENAQ